MILKSAPREAIDIPAFKMENIPIVDDFQREQIIQNSIFNRQYADFLSDSRTIVSDPAREAIRECPNSSVARLLVGCGLGLMWDTDRQDGKRARLSIRMLESLCSFYPDALDDLRVQHLLSDETKAAGAKKDADDDKDFANAILTGLFERAIKETDVQAICLLGLSMVLTGQRDPSMEKIRQRGRTHNVDVKASVFGKLKTGLFGAGSTLMSGTKTNTKLNRIGLGLIVASNAPSLGALFHMKHHVNKQIQRNRTAIKNLSGTEQEIADPRYELPQLASDAV